MSNIIIKDLLSQLEVLLHKKRGSGGDTTAAFSDLNALKDASQMTKGDVDKSLKLLQRLLVLLCKDMFADMCETLFKMAETFNKKNQTQKMRRPSTAMQVAAPPVEQQADDTLEFFVLETIHLALAANFLGEKKQTGLLKVSPEFVTNVTAFCFDRLEYTFSAGIRTEAAQCLGILSFIDLQGVCNRFLEKLERAVQQAKLWVSPDKKKLDNLFREYVPYQNAVSLLSFGFKEEEGSSISVTRFQATLNYLERLHACMKQIERGVLRSEICLSLTEIFKSLATQNEYSELSSGKEGAEFWQKFAAIYKTVGKWSKKAKHRHFCLQLQRSMLAVSSFDVWVTNTPDFSQNLSSSLKDKESRMSALEITRDFLADVEEAYVSASPDAFKKTLQSILAALFPKNYVFTLAEADLCVGALVELAKLNMELAADLMKDVLDGNKNPPLHRVIVLRCLSTLAKEYPEEVRCYNALLAPVVYMQLDPATVLARVDSTAEDGDRLQLLRAGVGCFPVLEHPVPEKQQKIVEMLCALAQREDAQLRTMAFDAIQQQIESCPSAHLIPIFKSLLLLVETDRAMSAQEVGQTLTGLSQLTSSFVDSLNACIERAKKANQVYSRPVFGTGKWAALRERVEGLVVACSAHEDRYVRNQAIAFLKAFSSPPLRELEDDDDGEQAPFLADVLLAPPPTTELPEQVPQCVTDWPPNLIVLLSKYHGRYNNVIAWAWYFIAKKWLQDPEDTSPSWVNQLSFLCAGLRVPMSCTAEDLDEVEGDALQSEEMAVLDRCVRLMTDGPVDIRDAITRALVLVHPVCYSLVMEKISVFTHQRPRTVNYHSKILAVFKHYICNDEIPRLLASPSALNTLQTLVQFWLEDDKDSRAIVVIDARISIVHLLYRFIELAGTAESQEREEFLLLMREQIFGLLQQWYPSTCFHTREKTIRFTDDTKRGGDEVPEDPASAVKEKVLQIKSLQTIVLLLRTIDIMDNCVLQTSIFDFIYAAFESGQHMADTVDEALTCYLHTNPDRVSFFVAGSCHNNDESKASDLDALSLLYLRAIVHMFAVKTDGLDDSLSVPLLFTSILHQCSRNTAKRRLALELAASLAQRSPSLNPTCYLPTEYPQLPEVHLESVLQFCTAVGCANPSLAVPMLSQFADVQRLLSKVDKEAMLRMAIPWVRSLVSSLEAEVLLHPDAVQEPVNSALRCIFSLTSVCRATSFSVFLSRAVWDELCGSHLLADTVIPKVVALLVQKLSQARADKSNDMQEFCLITCVYVCRGPTGARVGPCLFSMLRNYDPQFDSDAPEFFAQLTSHEDTTDEAVTVDELSVIQLVQHCLANFRVADIVANLPLLLHVALVQIASNPLAQQKRAQLLTQILNIIAVQNAPNDQVREDARAFIEKYLPEPWMPGPEDDPAKFPCVGEAVDEMVGILDLARPELRMEWSIIALIWGVCAGNKQVAYNSCSLFSALNDDWDHDMLMHLCVILLHVIVVQDQTKVAIFVDMFAAAADQSSLDVPTSLLLLDVSTAMMCTPRVAVYQRFTEITLRLWRDIDIDLPEIMEHQRRLWEISSASLEAGVMDTFFKGLTCLETYETTLSLLEMLMDGYSDKLPANNSILMAVLVLYATLLESKASNVSFRALNLVSNPAFNLSTLQAVFQKQIEGGYTEKEKEAPSAVPTTPSKQTDSDDDEEDGDEESNKLSPSAPQVVASPLSRTLKKDLARDRSHSKLESSPEPEKPKAEAKADAKPKSQIRRASTTAMSIATTAASGVDPKMMRRLSVAQRSILGSEKTEKKVVQGTFIEAFVKEFMTRFDAAMPQFLELMKSFLEQSTLEWQLALLELYFSFLKRYSDKWTSSQWRDVLRLSRSLFSSPSPDVVRTAGDVLCYVIQRPPPGAQEEASAEKHIVDFFSQPTLKFSSAATLFRTKATGHALRLARLEITLGLPPASAPGRTVTGAEQSSLPPVVDNT